MHGKKYRILEIYPFAARKPVRTCSREAYRDSGEARGANYPQQVPTPFMYRPTAINGGAVRTQNSTDSDIDAGRHTGGVTELH